MNNCNKPAVTLTTRKGTKLLQIAI